MNLSTSSTDNFNGFGDGGVPKGFLSLSSNLFRYSRLWCVFNNTSIVYEEGFSCIRLGQYLNSWQSAVFVSVAIHFSAALPTESTSSLWTWKAKLGLVRTWGWANLTVYPCPNVWHPQLRVNDSFIASGNSFLLRFGFDGNLSPPWLYITVSRNKILTLPHFLKSLYVNFLVLSMILSLHDFKLWLIS